MIAAVLMAMALAALVAEEVGPPPAPGPGTSIVQRATWATKPTSQEILRVYPVNATRLVVGGRAVISCRIRLSGAADQCVVVSEEPQALGFGAAAVRLSAVFKFNPELHDGVPFDGGTVKIPISFGAPDPYGPPTRLTYRQALNCISWHSARLLFLPGDALSIPGLARAEAAARVTGESSGKPATTVEADVAKARIGDLAQFTKRGAPPAMAETCAGGF